MSHIIEIHQTTTYIDTTVVEMTDELYESFKSIKSGLVRQSFLTALAYNSEWTTGDFVDGEPPHHYTLDGESKPVFDED